MTELMSKYQNVFKEPFEGDNYGDLSIDVWRVVWGAFEEQNYEPYTIFVIASNLSDAITVTESIISQDHSDDVAILSIERLVGLLVAAPDIILRPDKRNP